MVSAYTFTHGGKDVLQANWIYVNVKNTPYKEIVAHKKKLIHNM